MTLAPKLGVIIVIIALVGSVSGSYLLNAEDHTTCVTSFDYITDVAGSFHGTNADIGVDYNPRFNVTGYSVFNPLETGFSNNTIHGISYTHSGANGYWLPEQTDPTGKFTYSISSTRPTTVDGTNPISISYSGGSGASGQVNITSEKSSGYNLNGFNFESGGILYGLFFSPLSAILGSDPTFSEQLSVRVIAGAGGQFVPTFSSNGKLSIGNEEYYKFNAGYPSQQVTLDYLNNSATIGGLTYPADEVYYLWSGTTTSITAITNGTVMNYINPNAGVRPITASVSDRIYTPIEVGISSGKIQIVLTANSNEPLPNTQTTVCNFITTNDNGDTSNFQITVTVARISNDKPQLLPNGVSITTPGQVRYTVSATQAGSPVGDIKSTDVDLPDKLQPSFYISWSGSGFNVGTFSEPAKYGNYSRNASYPLTKSADVSLSPTTSNDGTTYERTAQIYVSNLTPNVDVSPNHINTVSIPSNAPSTITLSFPDVAYKETATTVSFDKTYWSNSFPNDKISMVIGNVLTAPNTYADIPEYKFYPKVGRDNASANTATNPVYVGVSYNQADGWVIKSPSQEYSLLAYVDKEAVTAIGKYPAIVVNMDFTKKTGWLSIEPVSQFTDYQNFTKAGFSVDAETDKPLPDGKLRAILFDHAAYAYTDHLITDTVVVLDGGGLYTQDGVFTLKSAFPNDNIAKLKIMSSPHVGPSTTIITYNEGVPTSTTWVTNGLDGWVIDGKSYKFADVSFIYAGNGTETVHLDGKTFPGAIYMNNKSYDKGHLYAQLGENGLLTDLGTTDSGWQVKMDGIWAMSTAYYSGENTASTVTEWAELTTFTWDMQSIALMGLGILTLCTIVARWKLEMGLGDYALIIGTAVILLMLLGMG